MTTHYRVLLGSYCCLSGPNKPFFRCPPLIGCWMLARPLLTVATNTFSLFRLVKLDMARIFLLVRLFLLLTAPQTAHCRVVPVFSWSYSVLMVSLGFTGFYWVLLGFTGLHWASLGFTWLLPSLIR